uniref:Uncharacterized protein n=1 Tax=Rhizophora mucronata TaxID=61149 RepID=A0A2P2N9J2_RHIMU
MLKRIQLLRDGLTKASVKWLH